MKKIVMSFTLLSIIIFLAAGDAPAANWEQLLQKIYPAAKKEGKLIFNTSRIEEIGGKEGVAQFKKRFPGIDVQFTGISSRKTPSRIIAEARSGLVSFDAFRSDPNSIEPLESRGLLLQINPKEIVETSVWTMFNNTYFKMGDHVSNFAYNTDRLSKAERPKSYEDLLDPKWKRKLVLDARGSQISHLLAYGIWSEEKFWNFVRGLKNQDPVWTGRSSAAMAKLVAGEGYVGNGSFTGIENLRRKGAPVDMLFLSPALSKTRGVAVVKDGAHPNAAKLFLGWVLSPEGIAARDKHAIGTYTPGTTLYKIVNTYNAKLIFEDTAEKSMKRTKIEEEVTAAWGIMSKMKKKK